MPTPTNISNVSYGTYFGDVGKIVWFDVSNNFNYFELYFSINLQQNKKTSIIVYDNDNSSNVLQRLYPADLNQEIFLDSVKLLATNTGVGDQPFGIINQPTY